MPQITFYKHDPIPLEMHKVRIVQKLNLLPTDERLQKIKDSGYNTFQLHNSDIFLDMLADSGVNAMSDQMQSAMLRADDAYAGSESYFRMEKKLQELFGIQYCLPAHQGRACENILATRFVKPGSCVIMNYHFTTAKAHITRVGGRVEELVKDEGLMPMIFMLPPAFLLLRGLRGHSLYFLWTQESLVTTQRSTGWCPVAF